MKFVVPALAGMETICSSVKPSVALTNRALLGLPPKGGTTNRLVLSLMLVLMFNGLASAHPFHVSYAEVDWNPKTGKLEVALKIDPDDLEQAVRLHCKKRINIDHKSSAPLIAAYVRDNFSIAMPRKKDSPAKQQDKKQQSAADKSFKWVGSEISAKEAWVYFELATKIEPGLVVENTLLANTHHPTNTVIIRVNKQRAALTFTRSKTKQALSL
ncbi:MAG: DUF6702 family protein [Planctomycetota bacterium]